MWQSLARVGGAALDALAPARCSGCHAGGSVLCERCVRSVEALPQPAVVGVRAAFPYRDEVRTVLHHGKFRDCRSALRALAWLGAARLTPPRGALVTPVPLSRRRQRERGYNQAEVVAAAFADFHRLPLRQLLARTRHTTAQSTLDRGTRHANVAGAFRDAADVRGETVWLVDDVVTTGATTSSARTALLAAGASRVEVAALAAVLW